MKLIQFGKIDKKYFIPIFDGIIMIIYQLFMKFFPKTHITEKNPFIENIYFSVGEIFAFIPYLILYNRSKNKVILDDNINDTLKESKLNVLLIYEDTIKKRRLKKYRDNLLISIAGFLETLLYNLFTMKCVYNLWFFEIIIISFFSYILFKNKLYKHHYISMIIIIILGFGLNVIEYFKSGNEKNKLEPFEILMKFLEETFFCLFVIISKYNIEKNYCTPYEILTWSGVIGVILNTITLTILNLKEYTIFDIKYPDNFFEYFSNYNIYDFIICFMIVLISFGYHTLLILTADHFTPFHILITCIIEESFNYFQFKEHLALNILGIIILIIIAFIFLIFIEVIEINIFNLSYNTKQNIMERSKSENSNEAINEIDDNGETKREEESSNSSISHDVM